MVLEHCGSLGEMLWLFSEDIVVVALILRTLWMLLCGDIMCLVMILCFVISGDIKVAV